MIDYRLIGGRIAAQRRRLGLTQEHVAERADITTVYLSKIENGHVRPTVDILDAICAAVGCDLGAVLLDASPASDRYQSERVVQLFAACAPEVKPVALELLESLSRIR